MMDDEIMPPDERADTGNLQQVIAETQEPMTPLGNNSGFFEGISNQSSSESVNFSDYDMKETPAHSSIKQDTVSSQQFNFQTQNTALQAMLDVVDEAKESRLQLDGSSYRDSTDEPQIFLGGQNTIGGHSRIENLYSPLCLSRQGSMISRASRLSKVSQNISKRNAEISPSVSAQVSPQISPQMQKETSSPQISNSTHQFEENLQKLSKELDQNAAQNPVLRPLIIPDLNDSDALPDVTKIIFTLPHDCEQIQRVKQIWLQHFSHHKLTKNDQVVDPYVAQLVDQQKHIKMKQILEGNHTIADSDVEPIKDGGEETEVPRLTLERLVEGKTFKTFQKPQERESIETAVFQQFGDQKPSAKSSFAHERPFIPKVCLSHKQLPPMPPSQLKPKYIVQPRVMNFLENPPLSLAAASQQGLYISKSQNQLKISPQNSRHTVLQEKIKHKHISNETKNRLQEFNQRKLEIEKMENDEKQIKKVQSQILKSRLEMEASLRRESVKERMEQQKLKRKQEHLKVVKIKKDFTSKINVKAKPLYLEIQDQFNKHEDEIKMQKQFYLHSVKKGSLPSLDVIQDHAKKQLQIQEQKAKEQELARKLHQRNEEQYQLKYFKNQFHVKRIQEDRAQRQVQHAKDELKALLQDKRMQYSKYVKDQHLPPISAQKKTELSQLRQKLKHPVKERTKASPGQSMSFINRSYSNPYALDNTTAENFRSPPEKRFSQQLIIPRSQSAFAKPTANIANKTLSPVNCAAHNKNFLDKSKMNASEVSIGDWQQHLSDQKLIQEQKLIKIQQSAKVIEDRALRKMEALHSQQNVPLQKPSPQKFQSVPTEMQQIRTSTNYILQDGEEVNGLLIDAVKAKLAVLDQLN